MTRPAGASRSSVRAASGFTAGDCPVSRPVARLVNTPSLSHAPSPDTPPIRRGSRGRAFTEQLSQFYDSVVDNAVTLSLTGAPCACSGPKESHVRTITYPCHRGSHRHGHHRRGGRGRRHRGIRATRDHSARWTRTLLLADLATHLGGTRREGVADQSRRETQLTRW